MSSPGHFKGKFLDTLGRFLYVLEHCGVNFSIFLFVKLDTDMVLMIARYMERDRMTDSTLECGKTKLNASYNSFLTTILTSTNNSRAPALAALEHT